MPPRAKSKKEAPPPAEEEDLVMNETPAMEETPTSHQPGADANDDASMADADAPEYEEEGEEEEEEEEVQRVKILPGSTPKAASFEFLNEGHTLGNALRYVIMKNPDVEFCAYAIPHPSEPKMNVRIQTYTGTDTTAIEALQKGLRDIQELCDVVTDKFTVAREEFKAQQAA